ncbi:hypothetical protein [Pseudoduganella plicata]|nr:hypothetical protein [Pseudoduganella plicata]
MTVILENCADKDNTPVTYGVKQQMTVTRGTAALRFDKGTVQIAE